MAMNQGKIVQIIGAVVDVEFPRENVPKVYDALKVQNTESTLGRIMDVLGTPIDEAGPVKADTQWEIHRAAPTYEEQSSANELLETGIKVIDLMCPFAKGGKVGLFGGAGVGKTVNMMELIN